MPPSSARRSSSAAANLRPDGGARPGLVEAVLGDVRALAEGVRGARRAA
jgi:hypothetical protein